LNSKKNTESKLLSQAISQIKNMIKEEESEDIKLAINRGFKLYLIKITVAENAPLASIGAFKIIQKLNEHGDVIVTIPSGSEVLKSSFKGEMMMLVAYRGTENIRKILEDEANIKEMFYTEVHPQELGVSCQEEGKIRGEEGQLGEIEYLIKKVETVLQKKKFETVTSTDILSRLKAKEIRVKAKDLDKLFILVGELVLIRNKLFMVGKIQDSPMLRDALTALDQTTNKLYSKILEIRLIPVKQIFDLSLRFVRDFSRKLGKQVDMVVDDDSNEVTLDRSIVEELTEPLIGIIKNALDHGIESPSERRAVGKPSVGTLKLSAKRRKEFVAITVEDDGRGIDVELVKKIAVKKGLIPQSTVEKLSSQEALQLIFLPGFSTKKLTLSTNEECIGLNTIKQRIEDLGGYLKIESEKGKGTKVTLSVPVTKAIVSVITVLLVGVKDEVYAIPSSMVQSIIKLKEKHVKHVEGKKITIYGEKIVPIYSLSKLLKFPSNHEGYVVILQKGVNLCGLTVSSILGFEDVAVRSEKILPGEVWILGTTILSNEKVALIIDPWTLIKQNNLS